MTATHEYPDVEHAAGKREPRFSALGGRAAIVVWVAVTVLAAVVPAARLQAQTLHAFRPVLFVNSLLIIASMAAVVILITRLLGASGPGSALAGAVFVIVFFWWALLRTIVEEAGSVIGLEAIAGMSVETIATPVVAVGLAYALAKTGQLTVVAIATLALVSVVAGAYVFALTAKTTESQPTGVVVRAVNAPLDSPNLVVVLLDGKPRSDVLAEVFGVDDASFRNELESLGFQVNLGAWSNANVTYASLTSMLALDTVVTDSASLESLWPRIRAVSGGNGEFFRAFSESGYTIGMSPPGWTGSYCGDLVDRCEMPRRTESNLYWLLRGTVVGPIVPDLIAFPWTNISDAQIDEIAGLHADGMEASERSLTWIHAALPHPPAVFDAQCNQHRDAWRRTFVVADGSADDTRRVNAMAEQIQCIDDRVLGQVRQMIAADPTVAVLIVSDHGTDALNDGSASTAEYETRRTWERMAVFSAFRGPDRCNGVAEQLTTVDTFREITRCLLDADVASDPVGMYLVPSEVGLAQAQPVIEITPTALTP